MHRKVSRLMHPHVSDRVTMTGTASSILHAHLMVCSVTTRMRLADARSWA